MQNVSNLCYRSYTHLPHGQWGQARGKACIEADRAEQLSYPGSAANSSSRTRVYREGCSLLAPVLQMPPKLILGRFVLRFNDLMLSISCSAFSLLKHSVGKVAQECELGQSCSWDAFVLAISPQLSYIKMSFKRSAEWAWKMNCSLQWWDLWGRGWQSSKNDALFLSHLQRLNVWGKIHHQWVEEGRSSLPRVRVPQPPPQQYRSPMRPAERCYFTYGLSQNALFLSSQPCAHPLCAF